jgi:hypothetical protein
MAVPLRHAASMSVAIARTMRGKHPVSKRTHPKTTRERKRRRALSRLCSCAPLYSGLSEQNNSVRIRRALRSQLPRIALDCDMNSQAHSPYSFEDTRHTNTDLCSFALQHQACVSRNRGPDTGIFVHLVQILAC